MYKGLYDHIWTTTVCLWSGTLLIPSICALFYESTTQTFASYTNINMIVGATWMVVYSYMRYNIIKPIIFGFVLVFAVAGAASFAFHHSNANISSPLHTLDLYGALSTVFYITWLTVYVVVRKMFRKELPESVSLFTVLMILTLLTVQYDVWYNDRYKISMVNISIASILASCYKIIHVNKISTSKKNVIGTVFEIFVCTSAFLLAVYNQNSAGVYNPKHSEYFRYDYMHGEWHIFVALTTTIYGLNLITTLQSEPFPILLREIATQIIIFLILVLSLSMNVFKASRDVYRTAWVLISILTFATTISFLYTINFIPVQSVSTTKNDCDEIKVCGHRRTYSEPIMYNFKLSIKSLRD